MGDETIHDESEEKCRFAFDPNVECPTNCKAQLVDYKRIRMQPRSAAYPETHHARSNESLARSLSQLSDTPPSRVCILGYSHQSMAN